MTFTATIMNQHAMWQSSDMRITQLGTGRLLDNLYPKTVQIEGSNGWMVLTFAGWGRYENVNISNWITEVLAGADQTVDRYTRAIESHANDVLVKPLAEANAHHMFVLAVYREGVPWICQIRNFEIRDWKPAGPALPRFTVRAKVVDTPCVITWPQYETKSELDLLAKIASDNPTDYKATFDTLAEVNSRVAANSKYSHIVSPHCFVIYRPYVGEGFSEFRGLPEGAYEPIPPSFGRGINFTPIMRLGLEEFRELQRGQPVHDRDLREAARKAITPLNRLARKEPDK